MTKIKKLNLDEITQKFGLENDSEGFFFKPPHAYSLHPSEPHRSEMYSVGLILQGNAVLSVDLEKYEISAPGIVAIAPELIRQWQQEDNSLQTVSVFFSQSFLSGILSDPFFLKKRSYFSHVGPHFVSLEKDKFDIVSEHLLNIGSKSGASTIRRNTIVGYMLMALLLEMEDIYEDFDRNDKIPFSHGHVIARSFKELLIAEFHEHRDVSYYADKLSITSKHLSQVLKEQIGKTASEVINEMVILEAKVLLQKKELTIAQVSDMLNFANPSFFGKYFKRNAGVNPKVYRESSI